MLRWQTRMSLRASIAVTCMLGCMVCGARVTYAQNNRLLAAAQQHAEEADFEAALQAFDRAEREGVLSRQDVVELLSRRPIVYHVLHDEARMQRDLACLAALEPRFEFGAEVLPEVRTALAAQQATVEPLRLTLRLAERGQALQIAAEYGRLPPGLVVEDRVYARLAGQSWQTGPQRLELANPQREPVEYFAQAFGPGGALLLERGSRQAPLRFDYPPAASARADGPSAWPFILGGGAVLLVGATVLAIVLMSDSDHTQLAEPVVR